MRSRYRINEPSRAHFVTATIVAWLPVFTTAARCDIIVESLQYCRAHKGLKIHAWVILDNHLHAILAAPDLSRVLTDFTLVPKVSEALWERPLTVETLFPCSASDRHEGAAHGVTRSQETEFPVGSDVPKALR